MKKSDIVKIVISELTSEGFEITPQNYQKKYCEVAKRHNIMVVECEEIKTYSSKLSPHLQVELKKRNIKSTNDFIIYITSMINRLSAGDTSKQNLVLITIVKRLLQTITFLHDKEATRLANISLDRIEYLSDVNSFEIIKDKWFDFMTSYDDSYLDKLKVYCDVKSNNLQDLVDELVDCMKKSDDLEFLKNISSLLIASLTPSIASGADDELAALSYDLKANPTLLNSVEIHQKIKSLMRKRVQIDKEEVKNRVKSLNEILDNLSSKLIPMMEKSSVREEKIAQIKDELNSDDKEINFVELKKKLEKIVESLEVESVSISNKFRKESHLVSNLQKRMHRLEVALDKAKKESKIDFLTKLVSRRGLDSEISITESAFLRYGISYSVVFFDLDNFKMINDTFGHDAGDVILKELGKILRSSKREVDVVGRYGGEEFLAILPKTDLKGAYAFANNIRQKVEDHKFMYKDERIFVTVSAGIACRDDFSSKEQTIESSDAMLYNAKNAGRNRVAPDIV